MATEARGPPMSFETRTSRGFSLIELIVVIAITAVLAVSAVPALDRVRETTQLAARDEVHRLLEHARARAIQAGAAAALRIDLDSQSLGTMTTTGSAVLPMNGPLGMPSDESMISVLFQGVEIERVVDAAGQAHQVGSALLWFGHDGMPERRSSTGELLGLATSDAVITSSSGWTVTVHRGSGMIE